MLHIERLTYDERAVTQCRVWRVTCHYHTMGGQSHVEDRVAAIHSHIMTAVMKLRHVEETGKCNNMGGYLGGKCAMYIIVGTVLKYYLR